MALAWHVIVRLEDDRVLAPSLREQLGMAAVVRRLAEDFELLSWRIADTHGHFVVHGDRRAAGEFARRLQLGLQRLLRPGCAFEVARIREVRDQRHLRNAFFYALRQADHHGVAHDPWHVAGNLPDLLGLRVGEPWSRQRVARLLPRVDEADLYGVLGWSGHRPDEVGLAEGELELLPEAAGAAVGLERWSGRTAAAEASRVAGVHWGLKLVGSRELSRRTGMARSTIGRLRREEPHPAVLSAVVGQLAWRVARGPVGGLVG